jgi:hypothetical protein
MTLDRVGRSPLILEYHVQRIVTGIGRIRLRTSGYLPSEYIGGRICQSVVMPWVGSKRLFMGYYF